MKHLEYFNHWYDKILNSFPFCLDDTWIKAFGIAWGFTENEVWNFIPRITDNSYQYANAIFFIRIGFPPSIFMQIRWSTTRLWQGGIGWKNSGRFAVHCRFQTDNSAAVGYHIGMPNNGQATGFEFGRH